MKKQILLLIFITGLISCTNSFQQNPVNNPAVNFKAGSINTCTQVSYSESKTPKIAVPDYVGNTPTPEQSGLKIIDKTLPISPDIAIIKDNKFIAVYQDGYSHFLLGKIFNNSGEEVVSRFKIVDFSTKAITSDERTTITYKVITDKKLDYFFVYYLLTTNNTLDNRNIKNEFFLKKFDLNGNQIGNEIKFDTDTSINRFTDITYSFNQDGKDLIFSWLTLIPTYIQTGKPCSECVEIAVEKPRYYHPEINYIKFDDKLNYCLNKISFNDILTVNHDYKREISLPFITKNRDKILLPMQHDIFKELNLKDNKAVSFIFEKGGNITEPYNGRDSLNKLIQDEQNNFYFYNIRDNNLGLFIYKLDNTFKVISSKLNPYTDITEFSPKDLTLINDKVQLLPDVFVDKDLNLFKLKFEADGYSTETKRLFTDLNKTILKLENNLLYVFSNYFAVI